MPTFPIIDITASLRILSNPKNFMRRSLKIEAIVPFYASNQPEDNRAAADHFAVTINEVSLYGIEAVRLAEFSSRQTAESYRKRIARQLDGHNELTNAAMCLWEAVFELHGDGTEIGDAIKRTRSVHGIVQLRAAIREMVEACDLAWFSAHESDKFDGPLDWEWCAQFLRNNLVWDPMGANLPELKV